ncbi:MAG: carbohydrate ABC transporter permease [Clostridia bacterium]|nr:carbohydrate ABC transporter permease [Clostridia bacterium]MBQ6804465.1 carbohydrate ABC transporter permease [Clostridia bacterium]
MAIVERKTIGERAFNWANAIILGILTIVFFYPMWHCLMASFSEPISLIGYSGFIFKPMGFSLEGYKTVLQNSNIYTGYFNTMIYLVGGTAINMVLTVLGAYALSRKSLALRTPITLIIVFTMYMDFGLIPAFLNIRQLGLHNTRWAIILPIAINTYNMIVMRTGFAAVPASLEESAKLDGANDFIILWKIMLPVCKATLAVVALFYAVGHWNSWFSAAIYLQDRSKFPLQLFLREILIANSSANTAGEINSVDGVQFLDELIKYCSIIISTVPILVVYPFVQKYFVTGVMVGSVKE